MPDHGHAGAGCQLSVLQIPVRREQGGVCPALVLYNDTTFSIQMAKMPKLESARDGCLIDTAIDPTTDYCLQFAHNLPPSHPPAHSPSCGPVTAVHSMLFAAVLQGISCLRWWEERQAAGMGFQFLQEEPLLSNHTR